MPNGFGSEEALFWKSTPVGGAIPQAPKSEPATKRQAVQLELHGATVAEESTCLHSLTRKLARQNYIQQMQSAHKDTQPAQPV